MRPHSHSSEIAILMIQRCGTPFNEKDISIALHESNFVLNKVANRAYESNSIAQGAFVGRIDLSGFTIDRYVFMDEVGTDSRCTNRPYAWVQKGELSKAKGFFIKGIRYSTMAAICSTGIIAKMTFTGTSSKVLFNDFFLREVVST